MSAELGRIQDTQLRYYDCIIIDPARPPPQLSTCIYARSISLPLSIRFCPPYVIHI